DALGAQVLYATDGVHLINLRTLADRLILPGRTDTITGMSDDGRRVLFLREGQAYIVETDGSEPRSLTSDAAGVASAILSGNGRVAYFVTRTGRLLKIDVDTANQVEIVGRTPHISAASGFVDAGMAGFINGAGFSDVSLDAAPPFPLFSWECRGPH